MIKTFLFICCICSIFQSSYTTLNISVDMNVLQSDDCDLYGVCKSKSIDNFMHKENSLMTLNGTANISSTEKNDDIKISSNLNVSTTTTRKCPGLENADILTQTQLINKLTAPCRYDRLERPFVKFDDGNSSVINVFARTFIYAMQSLESSSLQLQVHGLLQIRYMDRRLAFGKYAPTRQQPILGEIQLRQLIWVPHIFLANERDSSILGTDEKDVLTSISADGTIVISTRIQATLYCGMNLQKFPFDEQICSTRLESWMYNSSELILRWEEYLPIAFDPKFHLTEYALVNAWCNERNVISDDNDMRHGAFSGNYSSLNFTVYLVRESGYYIMDYFLPSIMIVAISWVSFWLQADQTPARTILGTSTMLTFITLASSQDNSLPKVSYIKISEIWFVACTLFIFSSLVEFAFVNSIWRRNHNVELKKVNSKYILKSTLVPRNHNYGNFSRGASSTNSLDFINENVGTNDINEIDPKHTWATMTPQEVSLYIDRKARFVFPLAFLLFNVIFWTLVYCL